MMKILIMLNMGLTGQFRAPNQHVFNVFTSLFIRFTKIVHDNRDLKLFKSGSFRFLRKILIIPKMGKIVNFWDQNQHFWTFFWMCSLNFPEIVPTTGSKNWCNVFFLFSRKILVMPKMGYMGHFGAKNQCFWIFL